MNQGENTLSLKVWNLDSKIGGVMYDCIKLETIISEASVSTTTNWTFGEMTAGTTYKEVTAINDEYYLRASTTTNRNFTVKASDAQTMTFADGSSVSATNYLEANGAQSMKVDGNDISISGCNIRRYADLRLQCHQGRHRLCQDQQQDGRKETEGLLHQRQERLQGRQCREHTHDNGYHRDQLYLYRGWYLLHLRCRGCIQHLCCQVRANR